MFIREREIYCHVEPFEGKHRSPALEFTELIHSIHLQIAQSEVKSLQEMFQSQSDVQ